MHKAVYYRWQYICSSLQLGRQKFILVGLALPAGSSYFGSLGKWSFCHSKPPLLILPSVPFQKLIEVIHKLIAKCFISGAFFPFLFYKKKPPVLNLMFLPFYVILIPRFFI